MDLNDIVQKMISPEKLALLQTVGMHKVAGAMYGIDELRIQDAVAVIGLKSWVKRAEARKIAEGINAYREMRGEKTADANALISALRSGALPGMLGAGVAQATSPYQFGTPESMQSMAQGAGLGVGAGVLQHLLSLPR